jgi:hypothetical protein
VDFKTLATTSKAIVAVGVTGVIALWAFAYLTGAQGPISQVLAEVKAHRAIESRVIVEIRKVCRNTARTEVQLLGCDLDHDQLGHNGQISK